MASSKKSKVKCPDCKREAKVITGKKILRFYALGTEYAWYNCLKCQKNFLAKFTLKKR